MGLLTAAQGYGASPTMFLMSLSARRLPISAEITRSEPRTTGGAAKHQDDRRTDQGRSRCRHPPRATPGAGFPAAGLRFSLPTLAAIIPDADLHTAATRWGFRECSIQETRSPDPRGESETAAIRRAGARTRWRRRRRDRPASSLSPILARRGGGGAYGRRRMSPGMTRTIRTQAGRRRR